MHYFSVLVLVFALFVDKDFADDSSKDKARPWPHKEDLLDQVTQYMAPTYTIDGETLIVKHSSNIEEIVVGFEQTASGKALFGGISVDISRSRCDRIFICFGSASSLAPHRRLAVKYKKTINTRKMWDDILELKKVGTYNAKACGTLNVIELTFPGTWKWQTSGDPINMQGKIVYHAIYPATAATRNLTRERFALFSNHMDLIVHDHSSKIMGIDLYQGWNDGQSNTAKMKLYETQTIFSKKMAANDEFFFVLAQDATKCGARLFPLSTNMSKLYSTFLKFKQGTNFNPSTIHIERTGTNIWAIALGFIVGSFSGMTFGTLVLCAMAKKLYRPWRDQMKKTYGKFAGAEGGVTTIGTQVTTMGGTGLTEGGNTTVGDVTLGIGATTMKMLK